MCFKLTGDLHSISTFKTPKGNEITNLHVFHEHGKTPEVAKVAHFGKKNYQPGTKVEIPVVIKGIAGKNGNVYVNYATFE